MKKTVIIGIVVSMLMTVTACGSDAFKLKETTYTLELGEQISTEAKTYLMKDTKEDIVKNTNILFDKNKKYAVDRKKNILKPIRGTYLPVGLYKATATYKKESKKFTVEIKDTTAPKFVDFKKEITIVQESKVDLASYFKAEDLSKVTIAVDGKFDTNVVGIYSLSVTAKDEYKNKVTEKATLKVVSKEDAEKEGISTSIDKGSSPSKNGIDGSSTSGGSDYVSSGNNTNNGNTGNSSGNSSSTPPPSNVCVPDGTYLDLGNSGRWFSSETEMDTWAWEQLDYGEGPWGKLGYAGYHAWTVRDSCGEERNDIWTVHFY